MTITPLQQVARLIVALGLYSTCLCTPSYAEWGILPFRSISHPSEIPTLTEMEQRAILELMRRGARISERGGLIDVLFWQKVSAQHAATHLHQISVLGTVSFTARAGLTDDDLKQLAGVPMKGLVLSRQPVTDSGMQYLRGLATLERLVLELPGLSDQGLSHVLDVSTLKGLDIYDSRVTTSGFQKINELRHLKSFTLRDCSGVTDAVVDDFTGLKNIQEVSLIHCTQLTSKVLTVLARSDRITRLSFGGIEFHQGDVEALTRLPALESLSVYDCNLDDTAMRSIGKCSGLRNLQICWTNITDIGLKEVQRLDALERLDISYTNITDHGLSDIRTLSRLQELNMQGTTLSDIGLAHLVDMRQMRQLYLDKTSISDVGARTICNLQQLEVLSVSDTTMSDVGIAAFRDLTKLRLLGVQGSHVTELGVLRLRAFRPGLKVVGAGVPKKMPARSEQRAGTRDQLL